MRGRSVLVATKDQLTAALALLELDGIARRLILYPPDLPLEHVPFVIASASVDAIVSDRTAPEIDSAEVRSVIQCNAKIEPADYDRSARFATEWVLLTSGTTGRPKMVVHTLASLVRRDQTDSASDELVVWSTFYDIRRYGGLQIFLRAMLTGASLVLSSARRVDCATFWSAPALARSDAYLRNALALAPRADESSAARDCAAIRSLVGRDRGPGNSGSAQIVLSAGTVAHAFASTEAGVAFEVSDGLAGFPASLMGRTWRCRNEALRMDRFAFAPRASRPATSVRKANRSRMRMDSSTPATCSSFAMADIISSAGATA